MVAIVTPPPSDYKPLRIKKSEFDNFVNKQAKRLRFFSLAVIVLLLVINLVLAKQIIFQVLSIAIALVVTFLALKDRRRVDVINELKNSPGEEIALKPGFTGLFKRDMFVILFVYIILSILILVFSLD